MINDIDPIHIDYVDIKVLVLYKLLIKRNIDQLGYIFRWHYYSR